ncbi:MAG: O-antigen ligase family protein [Solirubrobacteraceae bacterium]
MPTNVRGIGGRLTILTLALGVAIVVFISVGTGGLAGSFAVLLSAALLLVGLRRARADPQQAVIVERILSRSLLLLPGGVLIFLAYNAGGFFPGPTSFVAVLLALILAAKLIVGRGAGPSGGILTAMVVALSAYAAWVLLSAGWSQAPERALAEADLAIVYGLGFILFATSVRSADDMRWVVRGLAAGAFVVCLGGFLSRTLPGVWPIASSLDNARIGYPLTYWNALGMVAALGIVLCVGLTSDDRASRLLKTLGALPVPVLAVTLLLTFSRGAIAAGAAGLLAYVLLGRPRSLLSAAVAVVPSTGFALLVGYRATSLAHHLDGSPLQASEGRRVAVAVAVCALAGAAIRGLLAGLDTRLVRRADHQPMTPARARFGWAAAIGVVVAGALAVHLPGALTAQYNKFVKDTRGQHALLRDRLTDPGADGRIDLWRVALHAFRRAPAEGSGAGTYDLVWAVHRPPQQLHVRDAHSIYLENLAELGIVGLALLAFIVLGLLVALALRARGPERTLYAAAFAGTLAWAIHAGVDWDWEMPAVTLPVFVLAGAALGRAETAQRSRRRPLLALVVLAVAVAPALLNVSQSHLDAGLTAFDANDCAAATSAAHASLEPLDFRHGAHEILGYCDLAQGARGAALAEMAKAVDEDPKNWEPHYGLAIVRAVTGRDPRTAARAALARNPYDPVVAAVAAQFRRDPRRRWATDAASDPLPVNGHYGAALPVLRANVS